MVGELAEAARIAGVQLGLYLSPWDTHEPCYGKTLEYNEFYLGQMTELLTGFVNRPFPLLLFWLSDFRLLLILLVSGVCVELNTRECHEIVSRTRLILDYICYMMKFLIFGVAFVHGLIKSKPNVIVVMLLHLSHIANLLDSYVDTIFP